MPTTRCHENRFFKPVSGFSLSRLGTSFAALTLPPVCTKLAAALAAAATATTGKLMLSTMRAIVVGDAGSVGWRSASDNKAPVCSVASAIAPLTTDSAAMKPRLCDNAAEIGLSPSRRALASRLGVAGSVLSLIARFEPHRSAAARVSGLDQIRQAATAGEPPGSRGLLNDRRADDGRRMAVLKCEDQRA